MRQLVILLVLLAALAGIATGCGTTPEPTKPPPTQTPWYIIVTATPEPDSVAEIEPTPVVVTVIVTATPVRAQKPTSTPAVTKESTDSTVAPTEPVEATTSTPSATTEPPAGAEPTDTPAPADIKYPAPTLLEPPNNMPVAWKSTVLLKWEPLGELAENEYYHIHLERPPKTEGEQWYGDYLYTKDTEFLLERTFLAPFHLAQEHGHAVVYWWVRAVQQVGEDENEKPVGVDISTHSEKRTLILEPKP